MAKLAGLALPHCRKKSFNQPAKLAERVIAPGEAAEPGETQTKIFGAHEVGDG